MTPLVFKATYRNGAFEPIGTLSTWLEGQTVTLSIVDEEPEVLRLANQVFAGLNPEEVDEIEAIALNRSHFFGKREEETR